MAMHDWTRVPAGIFHAFHHEWISEIGRSLNGGLLPAEYYALPEQQATGFGPDVLTPQNRDAADHATSTTAVATRPTVSFVVEASGEYLHRRKSTIAVRHVSGDRVVAIVEIVSPGNKNSAAAFRAFVDKACELIERRVHLLIVDPFPPGRHDPFGLHAAIWQEIDPEAAPLPRPKPLAAMAYEAGVVPRGYVEPIAVGDPPPTMPVFLTDGDHVSLPLAESYERAWLAFPRRWRQAIELGSS